jgi:hypothetical protein
MTFFKRIVRFLFGSSNKTIDGTFIDNKPKIIIDKVAKFNRHAPHLFDQRLKEYGYELTKIESSEHNGFLWATHHYYENKTLGLTVDVQQAPYYTDYGFSIFLFDKQQAHPKLLCNVPHELHDDDDKYLVTICEKFFSNHDVISLLKGETLNHTNHVRLN